MQKEHRSPTFLVELMLVIFFFCISCVAILQLFAVIAGQSRRASLLNAAQLAAENLADELYLSDDTEGAESCLTSLGFEKQDTLWEKEENGGFTLNVSLSAESAGAGTLRHASITASAEGQTLLSLPCDRYFSGEVQP